MLEVAPEISPEALFRQLVEKSGVEASSIVLYQFDVDIEDWVKVGVEEVEPEEGAKFRVEKSAGGNKASPNMGAAATVPPEVRINSMDQRSLNSLNYIIM